MILAIGAKVKLRYSGESGTICAMLDDGMLMVRLDGNPDMEIPVFVDDIVRNVDAEREIRGARFVSVPDKTPAAPPRREIKGQYRILKPRGLQLCFEPEKGPDGIATCYKIWLLNDSSNEYLYEIDIYARSEDVLYEEGKLGGETLVELGVLTLAQLNDHPEVWMEVRRISTEGIEAPKEAFFKIKVKNFFKRFVTAPISTNGLIYSIFNSPLRPHLRKRTRSANTLGSSCGLRDAKKQTGPIRSHTICTTPKPLRILKTR